MDKVKKTALVKTEKKDTSVESFISQAIAVNVPIETLERLLAMRDKVKAEQAKEAFVGAMAKFQARCPVISKVKVVKDKYGKERYRYAPLDSIVSQVKDALAKNGLSYDFDEVKDDKFTAAVCTITHILGHSKQSTFKVEIGKEDYMTDTQKYGARMTFAKRYAFCNALGILTGDEDTDANEPDEPVKKLDVPNPMLEMYTKAMQSVKTEEELKTTWASMPIEIKEKLNSLKDEMKVKFAK